MTGALERMGFSALCCVAFMGVGAPAGACSLLNPAEYMFSAVTLAARFGLASLLLGGLILCLDLYEKRLSLALPMAGWLVLPWGLFVYQHPAWDGAFLGGYAPDCTVLLVEMSQYVLGLVSALLGWRIFEAAWSN
jgi:hypothetical protein